MKIINDNKLHSWNFINLEVIEYINKNWEKAYWEYVSRKWPGAVACLVEHIENQSFIFVEQYRLPVRAKVLELVAGVIDKDKSYREIICEEILEETWYTAHQISSVLEWPKSPGLTNEFSFDYYAQVQWLPQKQTLSESEDIQVIEIKKQDLFSELHKKRQAWVLVSPWIYANIFTYLYNKDPDAIQKLLSA